MATLYPENQQYVPKGGQPSSRAFLPGLMKKLQEDVRKATANKMQESISSNFIPQYGTEPNAGKTTLEQFKKGEFGFETGTPISPSSERYESLPSYGQYVPADTKDINAPRWVSPGEQAKVSNLPGGMGSYMIDPSQQGKLIKSERVLVNQDYNPGFKDKLLGGLSPMDFQVDHIIPLWAGGADTISNLQNLDLPTHQIKTNAQAVPLTLLANGKIDLNRARSMAMTWKDKDVSNLPNVGDNGMYPVDFAEKIAKQWEEQMKKGKPVTFKEVWKGIPKAMQDFGKGWLPTPVSEFLKQGVSGLTAGIVPAPYSEEAGAVSKIAGTAGHIAGTIFGLGKFGKLLGVGKNAILARRGTTLAGEAMEAVNLAIDIGKPISTFTKMRHSATLLSLWGQIGLTGRELTGQQETEAKNHMTQFLSDVAFGSLLGASGQTVRGYSQVGAGTTILSLIGGNNMEDSLKDGALMTALHTMGFKGRFNEINDIVYKRSAATLNQYLGEIVPTVKKGQGVPSVLKLDIPAIENMRQEYQKQYPNDPRISNVEPITGEYDAVDFLTRAALIKQGETLNNAIKKTDIPQEQIEAEIRRIGTAGVQLYNQTLPPKARIQKQKEDLQSIFEQLKPKVSSEQLKQGAPSIEETFKNIPLTFPERVYEKPEGVTYQEGHLPLTGYASDIDPISKANIETLDKGTGWATSNRIILVSDPKTTSVMRLINFEAMAKGEKPPIANPEQTLRAYYIAETPEGRELRPVGYAATAERIGSREYNINLNYQGMIDRIRNIIATAESPETLMERLNKDRSKPNVNLETAQNLFNQRQTIKNIEDANLLSAIKASAPLEKYDSNLNNSLIAEAMNQNGLSFLTGNINKLTKTGTGEPFVVLSIKDQNWLESMALRDKKVSPIQETIKEITERKKAVDITTRMQESKKLTKEAEPLLLKEKKASEIKSSTVMPVSRAESLQNAIKTLKSGNIPSIVKKAPTEARMTPKEVDRALYRRLSERVNQIVQKATNEGRLPEKPKEKKAIDTLGKKMVDLIKKNRRTVSQETKVTKKDIKSKDDLLKDALLVAEDAMDSVKSKYFEGTQRFSAPLRNAARSAELIIRNNKLRLSPQEQRNLERDFNSKVEGLIKEKIAIASRGYEPTGDGLNISDFERLPQKIKGTTPRLTQDQELAKAYNLKLKDDGFLFLKNNEPVFADPKDTRSPLDVFGNFLKKDLEAYNKSKTYRSEAFVKDLDTMAKTPGVYSLFAKTIKESLNEAIVSPQAEWLKKAMEWNPGKSFTFNSLLKQNSNYMKNLFETVNLQGRYISEPIQRIIAQVEGKSLEQIKKIDTRTKKIEQQTKEQGATDLFAKEEVKGVESEELSRMTQIDLSQAEKVQDLTLFEWRFPSLIYEDITGKTPPKEAVVADGIRFAKDFISSYSPKIIGTKKGGKIEKKFFGKNEWEKIKNKIMETEK